MYENFGFPGPSRIVRMSRAVVCIAPTGRLSRRAALEIAAGLPGVPVITRSIAGYLAAPRDGRRILLCPAGNSVQRDLAFLRRVARRLLWPAPSADFQDAIGGLRTRTARAPARSSPPRRRPARGLVAALLLEGRVDGARARAALDSSALRDWIVESPRHVQVSERLGRSLERAGVRWTVLEPVEVVALFARPELARARAGWKRMLPRGIPVWIRNELRVALPDSRADEDLQ